MKVDLSRVTSTRVLLATSSLQRLFHCKLLGLAGFMLFHSCCLQAIILPIDVLSVTKIVSLCLTGLRLSSYQGLSSL